MNQSVTASDIVKGIKHDLSSGASELVQQVLVQLANYAPRLREDSFHAGQSHMLNLLAGLKGLRPSMAPLQNVLSTFEVKLRSLKPSGSEDLCHQIASLCQHMAKELTQNQLSQRKHAVNALVKVKTIMTFSRSSAVLEVLKSLSEPSLGVIVCESRPGNEGYRLASELAASNLNVEYIVDAAAGVHVATAEAVVVGADSILSDGSVVNKCGTSLLALAAQQQGVPFYVLADSLKLSQLSKNDAVLEEMPVGELNAPESPLIQPHNVYFDITDKTLISAYISEHGVEAQWPWTLTKHRREGGDDAEHPIP